MQTKTRALLGLILGVSAVHVGLIASRPSVWLAQPSAAPLMLDTRLVPPPPTNSLSPKAAPKPQGKPALKPLAQAPTPAQTTPTPDPLPPQAPHSSADNSAAPEPVAARVDGAGTDSGAEPDHRAAAKSGVPAPPTLIPPSVTMKYEVNGTAKGFTYSANAELVFAHDGKQYDARLTVGAFLLGSRVDTSQGQIGATGLEPLRYSQKTRGERAAHFQRDKGLITFSSNRPEVALQSGAQDRLSVLLQLAALIAADPQRASPGQSIAMQVASADNAESWVFKIEEPELLNLPAGELRTLKLQRLPKGEYAQRVEVWLSPAHAYLPVRLRITNSNGDVVDQLWRN
jgi:Protein of unknown function (DUF3108)